MGLNACAPYTGTVAHRQLTRKRDRNRRPLRQPPPAPRTDAGSVARLEGQAVCRRPSRCARWLVSSGIAFSPLAWIEATFNGRWPGGDSLRNLIQLSVITRSSGLGGGSLAEASVELTEATSTPTILAEFCIMFDLLIRNGKVVDGTGSNWFYGDVAITGDVIQAVGRIDGEARRSLDATDLVVAPGFVDIHAHSDVAVYTEPECRAKVLQGVTTEVNGNCGYTIVPSTTDSRALMRDRSRFLFGDVPGEWSTLAEFYADLTAKRFSVNVAQLIGHGALRAAVLGLENRAASPDELRRMKGLLAQGLDDGAFGMSTGLIFEPSSFADTEELISLCETLRERGGLYVSHVRGERETALDSVRELLETGERSGVPVHMSHMEAVDRPNWGKVEAELSLLTAARLRGVDVSYDMYPYRGSPVRVFSIIPRWAAEGGIEDVRRRLSDLATRQRIVEGSPPQGWEQVIVSRWSGHRGRKLWGRSIADLAREEQKQPWDVVFDLFVADPSLIITQLDMLSETDIRRAMAHPLGMVASDGTHDPDALRHPRLYSAFAELLGKYVREEQVLRLEEAIRKITSAPARRLGMTDIGILQPGAKADLTVFDPERIRSRATYLDPEQHPEGIEWVIVSGVVTVSHGLHTGVRAGRVLRRNQWTKSELG